MNHGLNHQMEETHPKKVGEPWKKDEKKYCIRFHALQSYRAYVLEEHLCSVAQSTLMDKFPSMLSRAFSHYVTT